MADEFSQEEFLKLLQEEKNELLCCLRTKTVEYPGGSVIMEYSRREITQLGIVLEGSATLFSVDVDGNRNILDRLGANSVFGEMFVLSDDFHSFTLETKTGCKVLYLNYKLLISKCGNNCIHHNKILSNLFYIMAVKNRETTIHLDILSQRTIRNKLLTYFSYLGLSQDVPEITVPLSWTDVSDYVCVERTSMMRELKNMNRDGIIESNGKKIRLTGI